MNDTLNSAFPPRFTEWVEEMFIPVFLIITEPDHSYVSGTLHLSRVGVSDLNWDVDVDTFVTIKGSFQAEKTEGKNAEVKTVLLCETIPSKWLEPDFSLLQLLEAMLMETIAIKTRNIEHAQRMIQIETKTLQSLTEQNERLVQMLNKIQPIPKS